MKFYKTKQIYATRNHYVLEEITLIITKKIIEISKTNFIIFKVLLTLGL